MRFRFDPEHDELRLAARRLLDSSAGPAEVHRLAGIEPGWDRTLVQRLSAELGVFGLAIPERFAGSGFGALELGVVFREAGRTLLCAPLLSTTLASQLLLTSGDEIMAAQRLPGIASGEVVATVAVLETDGDWDTPPATTARPSDQHWLVSGTKELVIDAEPADWFVASAATEHGPSLFVIEAPAAHVESAPSIDLSRRVARVRFDQAPATLVGVEGGAADALARTRDVGLVLLAAEQVGIAEACLDMASAWAKQRLQFGRAIGSFQAIKHKLATVRLELEAAVSASMFALWTADNQPAELASVARIAAYTCGAAALLAAEENIQVHGGMGATWEHPAHLYLRRASFDRLLLGDPQAHLEALAKHVESQLASVPQEV
jgi:alkylation response protein AidB-like acyl-CoA dehydrogenase